VGFAINSPHEPAEINNKNNNIEMEKNVFTWFSEIHLTAA